MTEELRRVLAEVRSICEAVGDPIFENFAVGLPASQQRMLLAETGLALPEEAASWWELQNGVRPGVGRGEFLRLGRPLSIPAALERRALSRSLAEQSAEDDDDFTSPDDFYRPSWLPIFATGTSTKILIDAGGNTAQAPVWDVSPEDPLPLQGPSFISIASLIETWLVAIRDHDWYRWDPTTQTWQLSVEWTDIPLAMRVILRR